MNSYVTIDGFKYAVMSGTYIRKWQRSYTSELSSNLTRINFVDRGPGLAIYSMSLTLNTWAPGSLPYESGITQDVLTQMSNLQASYQKISTPIQFLDIFGNTPPSGPYTGVFFTDMNQIINQYATTQKVYIQVDIELTEGAGQLIT